MSIFTRAITVCSRKIGVREAVWATELVPGRRSGPHDDRGNREEGQTPGTFNTQTLGEQVG